VAALIGAIGGWIGLLVAWHASVDHDVRLAPGATVVVVLTAVFLGVGATTGVARRLHGVRR
jgi:manganese/iron transport system permease protein